MATTRVLPAILVSFILPLFYRNVNFIEDFDGYSFKELFTELRLMIQYNNLFYKYVLNEIFLC